METGRQTQLRKCVPNCSVEKRLKTPEDRVRIAAGLVAGFTTDPKETRMIREKDFCAREKLPRKTEPHIPSISEAAARRIIRAKGHL